jgi:hypothetical protein
VYCEFLVADIYMQLTLSVTKRPMKEVVWWCVNIIAVHQMASTWVVMIQRRRLPYTVPSMCFNVYLNLYFFVNISTAKIMHETSRFVFGTSVLPHFKLFLPFVICLKHSWNSGPMIYRQYFNPSLSKTNVDILHVLGLYFSWHYKLVCLVKCVGNGVIWTESWSWSVYKFNYCL